MINSSATDSLTPASRSEVGTRGTNGSLRSLVSVPNLHVLAGLPLAGIAAGRAGFAVSAGCAGGGAGVGGWLAWLGVALASLPPPLEIKPSMRCSSCSKPPSSWLAEDSEGWTRSSTVASAGAFILKRLEYRFLSAKVWELLGWRGCKSQPGHRQFVRQPASTAGDERKARVWNRRSQNTNKQVGIGLAESIYVGAGSGLKNPANFDFLSPIHTGSSNSRARFKHSQPP